MLVDGLGRVADKHRARLLVAICAPDCQSRYAKSTQQSEQTGAVGEKCEIFPHEFHSRVFCVLDQLLKVRVLRSHGVPPILAGWSLL
jgi:hypothetical protein